jgi:WASH complex subunit strumpellin
LRSLFTGFKHEIKVGAESVLRSLHTELLPFSRIAPGGLKKYTTAVKGFAKPLAAMTQLILRIGQAQLVRKQVQHHLLFASRVETALLHTATVATNQAVMTDVREHYRHPDTKPYPRADNALLPELAKYVDHLGLCQVFQKLYVTTDPLPFFGLWMCLLTILNMPRLEYDRSFAMLVRRKASDGIDGAPFVVGVATALRQLHPTATKAYLAALGQFVRTSIHVARTSKGGRLPVEAVNAIVAAKYLADVLSLPQRVMDAYIPGYIRDALAG